MSARAAPSWRRMTHIALMAVAAVAAVAEHAPTQLTASIPNPISIKGILGSKLTVHSHGQIRVTGPLGDLKVRGPVDIVVSTTSNSIVWHGKKDEGGASTSVSLSSTNPVALFNFTMSKIGSATFKFNATNRSTGALSTAYEAPSPQDLTIIKSYGVEYLSQAFGWIYFVAWGVSFLPQVWENYRHKSVVGLNFDFVVMNLIAFSCYSVYYLLFYLDAAVQADYHRTIDEGSLPIAINDLCFAIWSFVFCAITAMQVFIYERGQQRFSLFVKVLTVAIAVVIIVSSALAGQKVINMLTYAYVLSYIKVGITFIKLIPQVYMNYQRKVTTGMSIYQWWLDLAGGVFSLSQQLTDGGNGGDWKGLFGNAPKTLLAFEAIIFDIILFVQHYGLYRHNNKIASDASRYSVETVGQHTDESARLLDDETGKRRLLLL